MTESSLSVVPVLRQRWWKLAELARFRGKLLVRWPWLVSAASFVLTLAVPALGDTTVQVDVRSILKGGSVTTYTNGKLIPWETSLDGHDGYVADSAAKELHTAAPKALPDGRLFPALGSIHPRNCIPQ